MSADAEKRAATCWVGHIICIVPNELTVIGTVVQWYSPDLCRLNIPDGWLLCDGSTYDRSDYERAWIFKPAWRWQDWRSWWNLRHLSYVKSLWLWYVRKKFRTPKLPLTLGVDFGADPNL